MTGSALQIHYEKIGGIAGVHLSIDVSADQLPSDAAALAARLLADPSLGSTADRDYTVSDACTYRLGLSEGMSQHSFEWNDLTVPAGFRPLLTALNDAAEANHAS